MGIAVYAIFPALVALSTGTLGYLHTRKKEEGIAAALCGMVVGGIIAWMWRHPRSWL